MGNQIDFYFDFSSPYGYLASTRIETIAEKHQYGINWHPILLGAVFKVSGQAPLTSYPLKGDYAIKDFARSAREHNTPFTQPTPFPIGTVAPSRAFYWAKAHSDYHSPEMLSSLVHALFESYYVQSIDISQADAVLNVGEKLGIERTAMESGIAQQSTKDQLRASVDSAIEKGIFGSPTMVVGNELFWGNDRLEQLDRWLERGGW